LDEATDKVFEIDHLRLENLLIEESLEQQWPVAYVKCPDCEHLLNREQLGARSGIVIDKCRSHGIWLDGGELGRALKWYKAGGQEHCKFKQYDKERIKEVYRQSATNDPDSWFIMSSGKSVTREISGDSGLETLHHIFKYLSRKL
jgi:Zn-finger nucleic acid-binding protein